MAATSTYLLALALGFSGGTPGNPDAISPVIGTWNVQVSTEVREVAMKLGMPEPQAQLIFNADNTFTYSSTGGLARAQWGGTYELHGHKVTLFPKGGNWPATGISGDLHEGADATLDLDGLRYLRPGTASLSGTWILRTASGSEDRSTKLVFKPDGTFSFTAPAATSKGKYTVADGKVTLQWTEVDGAKVELGSMHKVLPLGEDGSLMVDTFRYCKQ
jgi:hypothetical protein